MRQLISDLVCSNMDLFLLIDASGSRSNAEFQASLDFALNLAQRLFDQDIGAGFGVAIYNTDFTTVTNGFEGDLSRLQLLLSQVTRVPGQATLTGSALMSALEEIQLNSRGGPSVLVLVTDGQASAGDFPLNQAVASLAGQRVASVAVGVGSDVSEEELTLIAQGNQQLVVQANSLEGVEQQVLTTSLGACRSVICQTTTISTTGTSSGTTTQTTSETTISTTTETTTGTTSGSTTQSTTITTSKTTSASTTFSTTPTSTQTTTRCFTAEELAEARCRTAEVVFLVDGSESVDTEQFQTLRDFVQNLGTMFLTRSPGVGVGLAEYSTSFRPVSAGLVTTTSDFDMAIRSLRQSRGITNTGSALHSTLSFLDGISLKQGGQQFVILLTDGRTSPGDLENLDEVIPLVRDAGVVVLPIGVGSNIDDAELLRIAAGVENWVFRTQDFAGLASIEDNVLAVAERLCQIDFQLNNVMCPTSTMTTTGTTSGSTSPTTSQTTTATVTPCIPRQDVSNARCESADVSILMDGSESISPMEFSRMIEFVRSFGQTMFGRSAGLGVQLSEYSTAFTPVTNSFLGTAGAFESSLDSVRQSVGITNSGSALIAQLNLMSSSFRPGSPSRILLFITDGQTSDEDLTNLEAAVLLLAQSPVEVFVVGIGNSISQTELIRIGQDNPQRVFTSSFDALDSLLASIVTSMEQACRSKLNGCESTTPTTTVSTTVTTTASTSGSTSGTTSGSTTGTTTPTTSVSTTGTTSATTTPEPICFCPCFIEECNDIRDVMILVDGSESVGAADWQILLEFLAELTSTLPEQTSVLLAEYSKEYTLQSQTLLSSNQDIAAAISSLVQSEGVTNTATALLAASDDLIRLGRPGVGKALILLTDGRTSPSNRDQLPAATQQLRDNDILTLTVGFGRSFNSEEAREELISISGSSDLSFGPLLFSQAIQMIQPLVDGVSTVQTCLPVESSKCLILSLCIN